MTTLIVFSNLTLTMFKSLRIAIILVYNKATGLIMRLIFHLNHSSLSLMMKKISSMGKNVFLTLSVLTLLKRTLFYMVKMKVIHLKLTRL